MCCGSGDVGAARHAGVPKKAMWASVAALGHVLSFAVCCMGQARYESAYVHVMKLLKNLIDPSDGNASTLPSESSLSVAEREEFLQTLLQVPSPPSALSFCLLPTF